MERKWCLVFLMFLVASLANIPSSSALSRRSITITPSKTELELEPGSVWKGTIQISLDVPEEANVALDIVDFRGKENDEGGVPYFYKADVTETRGVLSRWIEVGDVDLNLQPDEYLSIPVTITVPKNAEPGGHYGAILFQTTPLDYAGEATGSGTASSIAALFLVRVAGDLQEQGKVVEFYMDRDVYETPPLASVARFLNEGNSHLKPQGRVEFRNWFGKLVGTVEINPDGGNVLPGDIRKYTGTWGTERVLIGQDWYELPVGNPLMMGRYKAKLWLWYGKDQLSLTAEDAFWVLPWRLIGLVWLALLIFFYLTRDIHYRYMKWIWKRAKKLKWRIDKTTKKKESV